MPRRGSVLPRRVLALLLASLHFSIVCQGQRQSSALAQPRASLEHLTAPWADVGEVTWPNTVAICTVLRHEHAQDVREWLRYHRWLGVDHIFLYDQGERNLLKPHVLDYVNKGFATYSAVLPLSNKQMRSKVDIHRHCIRQHRSQYSWLAILELNDYVILRDRNMLTLKDLLHEYRYFPGLSVHMVSFSSNGHDRRPAGGGVLHHYTRCGGHAEGSVKTIVNSFYAGDRTGSLYNVMYKPMLTSVNEERWPLDVECRDRTQSRMEPCAADHDNARPARVMANPAHRSVARIAVFHYTTRSAEDWAAVQTHPPALDPETAARVWDGTHEKSNEDAPICKEGMALYAACCKQWAALDARLASAFQTVKNPVYL